MAYFRHTYRIVDVYFVFYIIILHFKNFVPFYFIYLLFCLQSDNNTYAIYLLHLFYYIL